jgi:ammonium transporter, Amt family
LFSISRTGVTTYDAVATCNGCLTGLAAITGGAATVEPWAAVVIGMIAGWIYIVCSILLVRFRIDDAVDAIPVHMGGGGWGVLATGLFSAPRRMMAYMGGRDYNVGWFYEWVSCLVFWSFAEDSSLLLTFANDNCYTTPCYI